MIIYHINPKKFLILFDSNSLFIKKIILEKTLYHDRNFSIYSSL